MAQAVSDEPDRVVFVRPLPGGALIEFVVDMWRRFGTGCWRSWVLHYRYLSDGARRSFSFDQRLFTCFS
jgi:hypothetical protein